MNTVTRPLAVFMALRLLHAVLVTTLLLALLPSAWAQGKPFEIGPVPSWVETHTADAGAAPPPEQVAEGVYYLLSDHQVRVDDRERVVYHHSAAKALNDRGVAAIANIEIRFDPSFEKLTLHAINVRRGGQLIAKLSAAAVRVLQRETELEGLIFDGSKTANVFLDDVRAGDVVEHAYSIRGHNPVFGRKHFGRFTMQWSVPVEQTHARLLWPRGRELQLTRHNGAPEPVIVDASTHREHRWARHRVAGRQVENDAPGWFDPYASVQWSEFKDWQAVARWAVPLYRLPETPTPKVRDEAVRIAAQQRDDGARLLEALRFVQREVRYLGFEIGAGSHAPNPPELVLERRFGDCKDKSLLTIALLRALGIEAHPALVHTGVRNGIERWQPSPGAFNHVLVRARIGGNEVWIDPTRRPQRGSLGQLVQADFGAALVVDERSDGLVRMAGSDTQTKRREVGVVVDSTSGFDQPVKYTVTTKAQGAAADSLRAMLIAQSRDEIQKRYLNFYAAYYPGVEAAGPLEVADDDGANRLTVTERYVIKDFWQRSAKHTRFEASIQTPDLDEYIRQPRTRVRESPLSLDHPVDLVHVTEVTLPGRWNIKPDEVRIDDPAFEYQRSEVLKGQTLVLTDRFKSRRDHIAAGDVGSYAANLEKAREAASYTLHYNDSGAAATGGDGPHWLAAVVGTLALLGFITLALRVYRWDPDPPPLGVTHFPGPPRGLGGWLVLVAIGLLMSPFRIGMGLVQSWPSFGTGSWLVLTTAGSDAYHPLWMPALLFSLVSNLALLVGCGLVLLLFFKRRSSLPRAFVVLAVGGFVLAAIDMTLVSLIPAAANAATAKEWGELVRTGVTAAIWTAYFLRSRRVRATFIERHAASHRTAVAGEERDLPAHGGALPATPP